MSMHNISLTETLKTPIPCPECDGETYLEIDEWLTDTGEPTRAGVTLRCVAEEDEFWRADAKDEDPEWEHRWWQSEWQPTLDAAYQWAREHVRVQRETA